MKFTTQTLQEIMPLLEDILQTQTKIYFEVLNPDLFHAYAGSEVKRGGITYIYRGLKSWIDLAEILHCKMHVPERMTEDTLRITYQKLSSDSFHADAKQEEKYGIDSTFAEIHKMQEPAFFHYYRQALQNVTLSKRKSILNLGVNRADEFTVIKACLSKEAYESTHFVGIDHCKSAISYAKREFPENNVHFYAKDLNEMNSLNLGKFDLLISIGTLQSPSINFKPFFMQLVQNYLNKDAAIILGFPNSRWIDTEMIYGAKVPNYAMSELGHLFSDVMFCKKYLQQKRYRVTITGKHYIFLTATKIGQA
jgi:2-polyprenyl-3-methyl-5-hydroxy-6-metoxy-1,4-benzoquinol methylase